MPGVVFDSGFAIVDVVVVVVKVQGKVSGWLAVSCLTGLSKLSWTHIR
jgi:hypothetical protein